MARRGLIDQHDQGRLQVIRILNHPSPKQRRADGPKEFGRHGDGNRGGCVAALGCALHAVSVLLERALQGNHGGQRRVLHARQGAKAPHRLTSECGARFNLGVNVGLGIIGHRQRDTSRDQMLRVEPRIHLQKIPERPQQHPRADQKHQRQRHFRANEHLADFAVVARSGTGALAQSGKRWFHLSGLERQHQPEEHRGEQGERERKCQHARIDMNVVEARKLRRQHGDQRLQAERRHADANRGRKQTQDRRFGEQLPDNSRAARAQRQAHRDLPLPRGRAGQ